MILSHEVVSVYYRIAELVFFSEVTLPSFAPFVCAPGNADVTLVRTNEAAPEGPELLSGNIAHQALPEGWFFHLLGVPDTGLFASSDYTRLRLNGAQPAIAEALVRIALECLLCRRGYVTLHAAAFELGGLAYAFTAPSGTGKSTRARAWGEALGARLISGDRPLIHAATGELFGAPWDGKEACFRNVHYPLRAICEVRRSARDYLRALGFSQRRALLAQQSFLPMWDTETAALQMGNLLCLAGSADIVRLFCGPGSDSARTVHTLLEQHCYLKEEPDMKAKSGFVLRTVAGEHMLMPVGENLVRFKGAELLNDTAVFIWEKLQTPQSRGDLLNAILSEYDTTESVASADLDALLDRLRDHGLLEE